MEKSRIWEMKMDQMTLVMMNSNQMMILKRANRMMMMKLWTKMILIPILRAREIRPLVIYLRKRILV